MTSKVNYSTNPEIKIFQEYLRIPSVHPNIDYEPCIQFLKRQADDLGLKSKILRLSHPTKPIIIMTWIGSKSELPAILLNSHMDVVPVFEEHWTHPPFGAEIDNQGRIYARGAQDMKCVGTQYLGAIRALKKVGFVPTRTVHVTFVPEEEVGGDHGMRHFVNTDDFKALNIGFALDESIASANDTFQLFYAERSIWQVHFKINGKPGHGLQLFGGTVGEKASYLLNKLMQYREKQVKELEGKPASHLGHVTTVNLTRVSGGVQNNVIPPQITLTFDMRLALTLDYDKWEAQLKQWCEEAGGNIEMDFETQRPKVAPTPLDDSNKYWVAFKKAISECGEKVEPSICPGATDIRAVRALGIPSLGFMPINNTPVLLHDHDEFLPADVYLRGIEIYKKIIEKVTSLS